MVMQRKHKNVDILIQIEKNYVDLHCVGRVFGVLVFSIKVKMELFDFAGELHKQLAVDRCE